MLGRQGPGCEPVFSSGSLNFFAGLAGRPGLSQQDGLTEKITDEERLKSYFVIPKQRKCRQDLYLSGHSAPHHSVDGQGLY